jgi:hypothetical protein
MVGACHAHLSAAKHVVIILSIPKRRKATSAGLRRFLDSRHAGRYSQAGAETTRGGRPKFRWVLRFRLPWVGRSGDRPGNISRGCCAAPTLTDELRVAGADEIDLSGDGLAVSASAADRGSPRPPASGYGELVLHEVSSSSSFSEGRTHELPR